MKSYKEEQPNNVKEIIIETIKAQNLFPIFHPCFLSFSSQDPWLLQTIDPYKFSAQQGCQQNKAKEPILYYNEFYKNSLS